MKAKAIGVDRTCCNAVILLIVVAKSGSNRKVGRKLDITERNSKNKLPQVNRIDGSMKSIDSNSFLALVLDAEGDDSDIRTTISFEDALRRCTKKISEASTEKKLQGIAQRRTYTIMFPMVIMINTEDA